MVSPFICSEKVTNPLWVPPVRPLAFGVKVTVCGVAERLPEIGERWMKEALGFEVHANELVPVFTLS